MRRSSIVVVTCFTAAALCFGDNGGDTGAPPNLKQITIAGGDSQSATLGATLVTPLKVSAIGTDNHPFPGVVVTWTVTQGVAAAEPPASVTNAAGEATTSLVLGL